MVKKGFIAHLIILCVSYFVDGLSQRCWGLNERFVALPVHIKMHGAQALLDCNCLRQCGKEMTRTKAYTEGLRSAPKTIFGRQSSWKMMLQPMRKRMVCSYQESKIFLTESQHRVSRQSCDDHTLTKYVRVEHCASHHCKHVQVSIYCLDMRMHLKTLICVLCKIANILVQINYIHKIIHKFIKSFTNM